MAKVVKLEPKSTTIAPQGLSKSNRQSRQESPLTPELKDFIDRVLVPILVKEYSAVTAPENELARADADAGDSDSRCAAPNLKVVKL